MDKSNNNYASLLLTTLRIMVYAAVLVVSLYLFLGVRIISYNKNDMLYDVIILCILSSLGTGMCMRELAKGCRSFMLKQHKAGQIAQYILLGFALFFFLCVIVYVHVPWTNLSAGRIMTTILYALEAISALSTTVSIWKCIQGYWEFVRSACVSISILFMAINTFDFLSDMSNITATRLSATLNGLILLTGFGMAIVCTYIINPQFRKNKLQRK